MARPGSPLLAVAVHNFFGGTFMSAPRLWQRLFPAAAERLVKRDEIRRDRRAALRLLQFRLKRRALRVEHIDEGRNAAPVSRPCERERLALMRGLRPDARVPFL